MVVDAATGEVLALANEPSFDPNNRKRLNPDVVRNRAVTDAFEPGSTMKAFSIAAALELKRVTPESLIDTDTGKLTIGNRTIGDKKPLGVLTVSEVLAKSSNIGTIIAAAVALVSLIQLFRAQPNGFVARLVYVSGGSYLILALATLVDWLAR